MEIDDILKDLGWSDGFHIPVANLENKALEDEVQRKKKEKETLKNNLEDISDRVNGMKKHLHNIHNQLDINQNLIFAHNNQKVSEENLVKLAKIEENLLSNELKKIKKEVGDIQDRQKSLQEEINRTLRQVDLLNATIQWDKDALLAWDEEMSRGDDDTQMLKKFKEEDEAKFNDLELKRQYLGLEMENKRNKLIGLKNDILSMEQSLDKTGEMFRRQHVDRRTLVQQWEGSVQILYQRDEDINKAMEEITNLKTLAKERLRDLEEQKTFYENEERNNKETEKEIETLAKQISESKDKIRALEGIIVEENDEYGTLKTVLATTTLQFHNEHKKIKNLTKELGKKNKKIVELKAKLDKVKEDYENSKNKKISAVERTQQLEQMLKEEEIIVEKNLMEFKKLDDLMFHLMQQITELKGSERSQSVNICHIQSCAVSLKKVIAKANVELNRQKDIIYNLDFAYMEKDIQLNKMLGIIKEQASEKHKKRILELEDNHAKLISTSNLLHREINRLEEDMRRINIDLQSDNKEQSYLKNKREENLLLVECGQKQLAGLRIQNQNKQVEENVLKLRVKQAEKNIDKVGDKLFCLEKQKLELEQVIKEREIEIKTMKDILNVRRRVLSEQAAALNAKINLARVKVENLKTKYEVTVLKLGKDENGEPLSVVLVKIKRAQEKFELQELGDKLDSKIKKTEKEILAMENTLKVVNATNRAFKNNFQNLDESSPEQIEKEQLEKTRAEISEEHRRDKLLLKTLESVTMDLEKEYQDKLNLENSLINLWTEKNNRAAESDKELQEQEEKLQRAEKQLKKLIKEIRGTTAQKFQTFEEKDIELRELLEQNEYGLQQLAELVAKTFDTAPVVNRYLSEKGLSLPMVKSPSDSIKYASTSSLGSITTRSSASSKSAASNISVCIGSPSVVTLDSSKLDSSLPDSKEGKGRKSSSSSKRQTSIATSRRTKTSGFSLEKSSKTE